MSHLFYSHANSTEGTESEVQQTIKIVQDRNLEEGSTIVMRVPADPESFTELCKTLLKFDFRVLTSDKEEITEADKVFLDQMGGHAFWKSVVVKVDGVEVSDMNYYPYSSKMQILFGTSLENRQAILRQFDASSTRYFSKSDITQDTAHIGIYRNLYASVEKSKWVSITMPIFSDFLKSSQQLLPPGCEITLELKRAPTEFTLCNSEKSPSKRYLIELRNPSLYIRRINLKPSIKDQVMESLKENGHLNFTRLEAKAIGVQRGSMSFRWLDIFNRGPVPGKIYITFASTSSIFGSISQMSTYFEHNNLSSLNVFLNGKSILVEPISLKYVTNSDGGISIENSNGREGYLTTCQVLNYFSEHDKPVHCSYQEYMGGGYLYAIDIGNLMQDSIGCVDLELQFEPKTDKECTLLMFTEKLQSIALNKHQNYQNNF